MSHPDFTENLVACFSPDRRYRYTLWRRWEVGGTYAMFIGLNPSTADEVQDDPTVRRCIRFAQEWGYSGLCMTNAFAYRATMPEDMKAQADPIGPLNDDALQSCAAHAGVVVAAWGVHGAFRNRGADVARLIPALTYLALTKDGHPRHPLYLRGDSRPLCWHERTVYARRTNS